jgi:hypothetical protein
MRRIITRRLFVYRTRRPFWRLLALAIGLVSFAAVAGFTAGYLAGHPAG